MMTLKTRWGSALDPKHIWEEYPRPNMVRGTYMMLNGYWSYAITNQKHRPESFDGQILVPFSPEAPLSGVNRQLQPDEYLWYERSAVVPSYNSNKGEHVLLHFEAVDQCAVIYVNGNIAARHVGGYLPFTVDITRFLDRPEPRVHTSKKSAQSKAYDAAKDSEQLKAHAAKDSEQPKTFVLTVRVQDFSDTSYHSRGKQKLHPGGMYYTAQSGIWQSVWMEVVPRRYLEDLSFEVSQEDGSRVHLTLTEHVPDSDSTQSTVRDALPVSIRVGKPTRFFESMSPGNLKGQSLLLEIHGRGLKFDFAIPSPRLWSTDSPWIYPVEILLGEDQVCSYFAIRTFSVKREISGNAVLLMNERPLFLNGVLDQGYWPDGLYTAPSDEALIYDIQQMKALGFTMIRKHAKIENRRWYYHCDRLGMVVWQDMVNGGGKYSALLLTYLPTVFAVPGPSLVKVNPHSPVTMTPSSIKAAHCTARPTQGTPFGCAKARLRCTQGTPFGCSGALCTSGLAPLRSAPDRRPLDIERLSRCCRYSNFPYRAADIRETVKRIAEREIESRITARRDPRGRAEYWRECRQTIDLLRGHPCIMTWVLFNEGWGQFDTKELTEYVKKKDPGRMVDSASGWFEHKTGDFKSVHNYFRKLFVPEDRRLNALSEYGGGVCSIDGHSMYESTYGYHNFTGKEEFEEYFLQLILEELPVLRKQGLCAAVYTQLSDIEEETNGLLTYDRKICKISDDGAAKLRDFGRRSSETM